MRVKTTGNTTFIEIHSNANGWNTCIIDTEDLEKVLKYKWYTAKDPKKAAGSRLYVRARMGGVQYHMHRVVTDNKYKMVDHINGNPLDNRKQNLRPTTPSENQLNRGKQVNNKSGYYNVSKLRDKWQVTVKRLYIGVFECKHKAAKRANIARLLIYGPDVILNEVPCE